MRLNRVSAGWARTLVASSLVVASAAGAAVPATTPIEGVLLSSGGGPAADGNYTITVAIYGAETGGSAVWTESGVTIAAKGGQFSYQLGAKTPLSSAVLNLPAAWVGIQIGTDPELPRKPMGASPYALRTAVAEALECSGCLKAGNLDAGVLQPYAKSADLGAYAKTADLSAYAKASDLTAYAKKTDLSSYATVVALADYVKASSLAKVAGTGSYADLKDAPTLHKVATTGSYADLTNQPKLPVLGASCGTNLVLKGIKADGSYECVSAGIGPDLINEISNDLIWNQFVDSKAGTTDAQIKDGFSAGVVDSLAFPDVGLAEKIWVEFSGLNSDMSKVVIELFGPGMSSPYVLYNGSKTGTALVAKFNGGDALVSGDMNKDWLNKNIKGNWSITVKDTAAISVPPGTPPFVYDGKFNWSVNIQTLSSKKIQIKGNLLVDGGIKVGADTSPCTAANAGTIRWTGTAFLGCNGKIWTGLQGADGSSAGSAAESCKTLHKEFPNLGDGIYWLNPSGGSNANAFQAPCNMTRDGGGWTMGVKMWYQNGMNGNTGAVGSVGDALALKGNAWKLSDDQIKAIIGTDNNFDVMFDQANYNSYYSSGNYEYIVLSNYTAVWTWGGKVGASTTTTAAKSYRISDNAVAWTGNFQCGDVGGWGINCYTVTAGPNPKGGGGCAINMGNGNGVNDGHHHLYMAETNSDTYIYICNGAQHTSSYNLNHRYWFR